MNNENRRARYYAHAHAQRVSSLLEDFLYFVYSIVLDDFEEAPSSYNRSKRNNNESNRADLPKPNMSNIDVVALFVNAEKGKSLKEHLAQTKKLDASITRDLYANTDYMWSGSTQSSQFDAIVRLMNDGEEISNIPQMDFFIIVIPISKTMRNKGIIKEDSSNRAAFFEEVCSCMPSIEVSHRLGHEKLPKSMLFIK